MGTVACQAQIAIGCDRKLTPFFSLAIIFRHTLGACFGAYNKRQLSNKQHVRANATTLLVEVANSNDTVDIVI